MPSLQLPGTHTRYISALLAGAVQPLGFSPFGFWPIVILSLAALLILIQGLNWRQAALAGYLFGVGAFAAGVHWVFVSLHTFGGMAVPIAGLMVVGFVAWLALFPALACALQAWLGRSSDSFRLLALVPALWVLTEWMRGFGSLGFTWMVAGYSQVDTVLSGWAPLAGVYAVSFATLSWAACLAVWVCLRDRQAKVLSLSLALLLSAGGWLLNQHAWSSSVGDPVSVGAVQGNIALSEKWQDGATARAIAHYLTLSEEVKDADIIVWPESALTTFVDDIDEAFFARLRQFDSAFVFGVLERRLEQKQLIYHNAVMAVGDGERHLYRKQHLVPFGEYLPLRPVFSWVLDYLDIPMSDFLPWSSPQSAVTVAGVKVGLSVCYEDAFARDILPLLPEANLLINVSEDAWFGDSLGPHQRLQMAQMRSLETRRPMVRVSNTGVTGFIDAQGKLHARLDQFASKTLLADVQPTSGTTPFVRTANTPVVVVCLVLCLWGWFSSASTRRYPRLKRSRPHR